MGRGERDHAAISVVRYDAGRGVVFTFKSGGGEPSKSTRSNCAGGPVSSHGTSDIVDFVQAILSSCMNRRSLWMLTTLELKLGRSSARMLSMISDTVGRHEKLHMDGRGVPGHDQTHAAQVSTHQHCGIVLKFRFR